MFVVFERMSGHIRWRLALALTAEMAATIRVLEESWSVGSSGGGFLASERYFYVRIQVFAVEARTRKHNMNVLPWD